MRISDQQHNRLTALKAIRRTGPVARRDLPALTGLSAGTISQLTGDLVKRELVSEQREVEKRNGRPRTLLRINPDGAFVVGASLMGAGLLDVAIIDLGGERRYSNSFKIGRHTTMTSMATAIGEALDAVMTESAIPRRRIVRAGLALPALVDTLRGDVHFMTTFPPGAPTPFAEPLAARLGIPVTIENDISCMARAEHWFGRAQALEDFTLVHIGFNIGLAEYTHGVPRVAANGLNPELGHLKIDYSEQARRCYCGARGCFTAISSIYGLLEAANMHKDLPFPPLHGLLQRFSEYLDRAAAGDHSAQQAMTRAGTEIGNVLASLVNATDISTLIIAISDARFLDIIRLPIERALADNLMPGIAAQTPVMLIEADNEWRWKGTAALALEQVFLGS